MTRKEHYRQNLKLALPVMIGQLGHIMVGVADSIMIGKLGTLPLAASAFANSIFIIPMVFGIGMAYGMTTPVANADGEGQPGKVRSYLKHGLYCNVLTAIVIFSSLLALKPWLGQMGQTADVSTLAGPYFTIISSSLIPLLMFLTFKQFAEGLSDTRAAMAISILANLVNVALNYLFIYGKGGFPAWGLNGAGYATFLARLLMFIAMAAYVFQKPSFKTYTRGIRWLQTQRSHFQRILQIGVPSGLQYIFEVSAFALAAVMMGTLGEIELAAHQIAISLATVSYLAASGFGAAANVRVSKQLGARNFLAMRQAAQTNFVITIAFMALAGMGFYFGRNFWPGFYNDDPAVLSLAAQLLVVAVFFQLFDGMQVTTLGALRGLSDVRIPTAITLIAYWVLGIPACYGLGVKGPFGPEGIWYGLAGALTVSACLLYWRFEYRCKALKKHFENKHDSLAPASAAHNAGLPLGTS